MTLSILVTGGMGFIGRHLVRHILAHQDVCIDIVDNLSNSKEDAELAADARIVFHDCSVANFVPMRYDQIYHLASPVGPAGVLGYAGRMGQMIIGDATKMASLALENNARLLDISTSEVYGKDPGELPQREDIDKIVPSAITVRLEYGVSKLASEVCLMNTQGLRVNIIRPFNIVGVGQRGEVGFVLPRFVEAALAGKPLTVFGDGKQLRTFTSVGDIASAAVMVMNSDVEREIFNVGNPLNLCSILDLAEMVIRLTGSASPIEYVDPRSIFGPLYAEAWNKIPNITKIRRLGWVPKVSLEEIVSQVIASYRSS